MSVFKWSWVSLQRSRDQVASGHPHSGILSSHKKTWIRSPCFDIERCPTYGLQTKAMCKILCGIQMGKNLTSPPPLHSTHAGRSPAANISHLGLHPQLVPDSCLPRTAGHPLCHVSQRAGRWGKKPRPPGSWAACSQVWQVLIPSLRPPLGPFPGLLNSRWETSRMGARRGEQTYPSLSLSSSSSSYIREWGSGQPCPAMILATPIQGAILALT